MVTIHSIKDLESMTQDQIETNLYSTAKALAADPTDAESRATFFLLNEHVVREWFTAAPTSRAF